MEGLPRETLFSLSAKNMAAQSRFAKLDLNKHQDFLMSFGDVWWNQHSFSAETPQTMSSTVVEWWGVRLLL